MKIGIKVGNVLCCAILCIAVAASSARADFAVDRSVMSEAYWRIWNGDVQRKIDAEIEANRKADGAFAVDAPVGTEVKVEPLVSGLFTRDLQKKPAYQVLDQLINREWRTCLTAKAERDGGGGETGVVKFRGFKGRYRLGWTDADGKPVSKFVELD